jgi:hypothetical protein
LLHGYTSSYLRGGGEERGEEGLFRRLKEGRKKKKKGEKVSLLMAWSSGVTADSKV